MSYKNLMQQKKNLEEKIARQEKLIREAQCVILEAEREVMQVNRSLAMLKKEPPKITEHAKIQYLRRITGIDMDMIEEAILPKEWVAQITEDGRFTIDDHIIVVKDNTVVTVVENSN